MRTWPRRAVGLSVVLLSAVPLQRVLDPTRTGPWAAQARDQAELSWSLTLWGTVLVGLVAAVGVVMARRFAAGGADSDAGPGTPGAATQGAEEAEGAEPGAVQAGAAQPGTIEPGAVARAVAWIDGLDGRRFAIGVGLLAGVLATVVSVGVLQRLLTNVDEMTALIHARYLAGGALAGPVTEFAEHWLIPNMLVVELGWVSQYPPGHLLVLATFSLVGAWWLAGPILYAEMVGFSAASFERLLPSERRVEVRIATLLLALSPFALLLAGGALSHLTAGACAAVALYCALRAAEGHWRWAFAAGILVGVMVLARPWTGLLLGPLLTVGVWWVKGGGRLALRRVGPWVAGGIPCAVLLFAYNDALFGEALTLGYEALYGPGHRLGFHTDPWSFPYGPLEAIGYSASDMLQLGAELLETPVSVTLVAGAFLLLTGTLGRGAGLVAAWAVLPVFGNALYWFHQPRMLFETAPAWILLAVLGTSALSRRGGAEYRWGVGWAAAAALLIGTVAFVPGRFAGYSWSDEVLSRTTLDDPAAENALVFVHTSWNERTAALLQASGMRNDSIQAVVRRNDSCRLHEYATQRSGGAPASGLPAIDLEQTHVRPGDLAAIEGPGGGALLRRGDMGWSEECVRQANADRFGTVALAPLLWQGDLPGLEEGKPLFVRDYGPVANARIRERFPNRAAFVFGYSPDGAEPRLVEFEQAMTGIWGEG